MRMTQRARRSAIAVVAAAAIGGSGVAVGAATAAPAATSAPAASATASAPAPACPPTSARASYADVVRQVLPSVVLISTSEGLGSGVVLDRAGNIVTNAHVAGNATEFKVQVPGDPAPRAAQPRRQLPARRPGRHPGRRPVKGLQPATFGDSAKAQAGDVVLAVGNPLGLSGSVTSGIISATGRVVAEPASDDGRAGATLPDAIQTSAPINPGNSGGALVTTAGEVIGIPTLTAAGAQGDARCRASASPSRPTWPATSPASSSTPGKRDQLAPGGDRRPGGHRHRPDGTPAGTGIVAVTSGGPAERAGLRPGDVITAAGGTPTPDTQALAGVLAAADPGDQLTLSVTRAGQAIDVKLTLGQLPG